MTITDFFLADVMECSSSPCENNGTCTDEVNSFTCGCLQGYSGRYCETGEFKSQVNMSYSFLAFPCLVFCIC